jgi:hypothetical protein
MNFGETTDQIVENYIVFVDKIINNYKKIGELINPNHFVTPDRINYALALWYPTLDGIESEYQRAKIQYTAKSLEYQKWEDDKFEESKKEVIAEYSDVSGSRNIKPSLKEYDTRMRRNNWEDYIKKKMELEEIESRMRFLLRMRDKMNKYDTILTTMSYNSRSEMKALSLEDRMNYTPQQVSSHKIRSRVPISKGE